MPKAKDNYIVFGFDPYKFIEEGLDIVKKDNSQSKKNKLLLIQEEKNIKSKSINLLISQTSIKADSLNIIKIFYKDT
jgi:hypothetical protein